MGDCEAGEVASRHNVTVDLATLVLVQEKKLCHYRGGDILAKTAWLRWNKLNLNPSMGGKANISV